MRATVDARTQGRAHAALERLQAACRRHAAAILAAADAEAALWEAVSDALPELLQGEPAADGAEPGPYLNLNGAAAVLGLHRNTVAAALERGELRGIRVGSRWRVPANGLGAWRRG